MFFYYSGHGARSILGESANLWIGDKRLPMKDVIEQLSEMGGSKTDRIVILDCCYAGAMVNFWDPKNFIGKCSERHKEKNQFLNLDGTNLPFPPTVIALTSAKETAPHGFVPNYLLPLLRSQPEVCALTLRSEREN